VLADLVSHIDRETIKFIRAAWVEVNRMAAVVARSGDAERWSGSVGKSLVYGNIVISTRMLLIVAL
jgi:hypothetical protein